MHMHRLAALLLVRRHAIGGGRRGEVVGPMGWMRATSREGSRREAAWVFRAAGSSDPARTWVQRVLRVLWVMGVLWVIGVLWVLWVLWLLWFPRDR